MAGGLSHRNPGVSVLPGSETHGSMNAVATVLVIDDEAGIRSVIRRGLEAEGHRVSEAEDGAAGLAAALGGGVDVVILDLGLPRLDGTEVLDLLHMHRPDLPVLVLTARDGVDERVRVLDSGAVDYVIKPFSLPELMARVRIRLRSASQASPQLRHGRVTLDRIDRTATVDDRRVALTIQESALLEQFLSHPEETLSRAELLRAVWGLDQAPRRSNLVDVGVAGLRRTLSLDCIETVRGQGYRFLG